MYPASPWTTLSSRPSHSAVEPRTRARDGHCDALSLQLEPRRVEEAVQSMLKHRMRQSTAQCDVWHARTFDAA